MAIRTYALYGCNQRLLIWMIIIIVVLVGVACVRVCMRLWTPESTNHF
jgi:hypothetical protein